MTHINSRMANNYALPRGPVFGWTNLELVDAPNIPSVEDLPHIAFTTSGRSAIYHALLQLHLPPDSGVLVPTYHCPTMVAPVLLAGHHPLYFGIRSDGLPNIQSINQATASRASAMIVSHYFGIAHSLHEVRDWCDLYGIALIEDCAHCYFGQAGERPIGAWGDYCTASLSKFFPMPESGLLGSAHHTVEPLRLARQGVKAQIKGVADVIETASRHQRIKGFNRLFDAVFSVKRIMRDTSISQASAPSISEATVMEGCNMARVRHRPLVISMLLRRMLPRGRIIAYRQRNFAIYSQLLAELTGTKPMLSLPIKPVAPYVFPLWVDDAERVYQTLRSRGVAVFRWDQLWPGTPVLPEDVGLNWSRHVLQLLCHQDLSEDDIRHSAGCLLDLLQASAPAKVSNKVANRGHPCPN